jgi:type I restriction enzyme, R subunit
MTKTTDTTERGLEALIEASLINEAKYLRSESTDYDKTYCVDKVQLFHFLRATQPQEIARLEQAYGNLFEDKFLKRLYDQIRAKGIIEILRNGIREREVVLTLFYKKPASNLNKTAAQCYANNAFSVTRQLRFSKDNTRLALDMVVFINGLPVATFELKNSLTKQNVKDAVRQYQNDRDPKEPLFAFARCLVHFAVDDELVYMTTDLKGKETTFLPFNKGFNHGAGNPINEAGLKTDYLWKEILSKDGLSNIIEKYAQIVSETDENGRAKRKLVFPRYHQLDLVRGLLANTKAKGIGQRYLIQHSAGSGKSHSITWLSHQLVELTDATDTKPIFDSVIVVTDRRALDRAIQDNIKQFAQVKGVVEPIKEGSRQLKDALRDGKKIIITTIQKFPFIVDEVGELQSSRFAIVIDEAHSSQSGHSAGAMNVALSPIAEGEEETIEDKINRIIESRRMLTNASYFAFTATPKNKTLETFGVKNLKDGKFHPCHTYSMKQAIEEEFILDVLQNYTTLNSYYKLLKRIENDPQFDTKRAQKKLRKFVESHEYAIRQKAEIMVDHFIDEVIKKRKINGQGKAMVVTNSIVAAIRYKLAFDAYLKEIKSPFKPIVAFSGSKEDGGKLYDEALMNGFPSADIPKEFRRNEYRFLIVAEKFQTGFDEPLLHTMYVDKPLSDIKAVQTLSRLNRAYKPYKTHLFWTL